MRAKRPRKINKTSGKQGWASPPSLHPRSPPCLPLVFLICLCFLTWINLAWIKISLGARQKVLFNVVHAKHSQNIAKQKQEGHSIACVQLIWSCLTCFSHNFWTIFRTSFRPKLLTYHNSVNVGKRVKLQGITGRTA